MRRSGKRRAVRTTWRGLQGEGAGEGVRVGVEVRRGGGGDKTDLPFSSGSCGESQRRLTAALEGPGRGCSVEPGVRRGTWGFRPTAGPLSLLPGQQRASRAQGPANPGRLRHHGQLPPDRLLGASVTGAPRQTTIRESLPFYGSQAFGEGTRPGSKSCLPACVRGWGCQLKRVEKDEGR